MKYLTGCIVLPLILVATVAAQENVLSADDWYENHYAPLYAENPSDKVEQLAKLFGQNFHYHPSGGTVVVTDGAKWIEEAVAGWIADGWLGSDLAGYESDILNATTAAFKTKWRDRYANGNVEFECGWYLADLKNDNWIITQYADIDCDEHNF